jgi:hypothetical protein
MSGAFTMYQVLRWCCSWLWRSLCREEWMAASWNTVSPTVLQFTTSVRNLCYAHGLESLHFGGRPVIEIYKMFSLGHSLVV